MDENENSFDLFGSESDSSPRVEEPKQATPSLLGRVQAGIVQAVIGGGSTSSSQPEKKKRKSGLTLFDSFDTFLSVLHFLNSFYTFYLLDTF